MQHAEASPMTAQITAQVCLGSRKWCAPVGNCSAVLLSRFPNGSCCISLKEDTLRKKEAHLKFIFMF